jgi:SAM-dependent methyltransferase
MDAAEWDARYRAAADSGEHVWSLGPNALVAEAVAPLPIGRAVDLGAGEGRHALWLAREGWSVQAVDFSSQGLAVGRAAAVAHGITVEWIVADAAAWAPDQPAELVLLAYLHLPRAVFLDVLARAAGYVASGGTLLVLAHDADNLAHGIGGPQDPDLLPDAPLLRRAAESAGLTVTRCEQVRRTVLSERATQPRDVGRDGAVEDAAAQEEPVREAIDVVLVAHRP